MHKIIKKISILIMPLSVVLTTGCITDSLKIPTENFNADVIINADDRQMVSNINITEKKNTFFTVNNTEKMYTTVDHDQQEMSKETTKLVLGSKDFGFAWDTGTDGINLLNESYSAIYKGDFAEKVVEVEFARVGKQGAAKSTVIVPLASTILTPSDGDSVKFDGTIPITWSPSGISDTVKLRFDSDCIVEGKYYWSFWWSAVSGKDVAVVDVPDTGSYIADGRIIKNSCCPVLPWLNGLTFQN